MTTKPTLTRPADLDLTKLHSPSEVRQHQAELDAYFEAVRAEAAMLQRREENKTADANRMLTGDEYFALAQEREAEKQAREAEHAAERQAAADAKAAYLASMPDVAEIVENNPVGFLQQVMHWTQHGYTMPDSPDLMLLPNFYKLSLNKPEAPAKKVK